MGAAKKVPKAAPDPKATLAKSKADAQGFKCVKCMQVCHRPCCHGECHTHTRCAPTTPAAAPRREARHPRRHARTLSGMRSNSSHCAASCADVLWHHQDGRPAAAHHLQARRQEEQGHLRGVLRRGLLGQGLSNAPADP
eukprot:scaffold89232_cov75-Phaeocystis_antarctica.AAC.1